MSEDLDDLLQPTVKNAPAAPRAKPWRVQSQFWVAFFGGVVPVLVIALINARRLGIDRRKRWLMGIGGGVALAILFGFWLRQPIAPDFWAFLKGTRDVRIAARVIAVALFLLLASLQKPAESHHQVFSHGEFDSLWLAGIGAIVVLGWLQTLLLGYLAWIAKA